MSFEWLIYAKVIAIVLAAGALYGLFRLLRSKPPLLRSLFAGAALLLITAASVGTLVMLRMLQSNVGGPGEYRGKQVPSFAFRLVSDDAVRDLAETRGKVVLINFWATW